MTERQLINIGKQWQQRLLPHWEIEWSVRPIDDDSNAICRWSTNYNEADIHLKPGIDALGVVEVHRIVVHELLHCVLRDLLMSASQTGPVMNSDHRSAYEQRLDHEQEQAIETLAHVLVALSGVK